MQFDQPKRRDFITLIGGAAAWPLAAKAQQPECVRRIGVLMNGRSTETEPQALRQPGWTEGQNLRIDMPNSRASMWRS